MARIAGLNAAEATDKMTAALRGFNMELNEASAQRVSDVYSELAAITAASTKEIANAMTKTASIASSAGMEFETTAAFLSQIIETTRESAETAGTAMKTVIARFQELKKAPDEIGEIDGEIVDANAIETALRSVGVALRDTNGQFRDLDDVFLELSGKWGSLDKNTQRYIATIAAGSRQQSRFIAMMSDYSRTQELVNAANTSAGASNAQFEKTMDSLESKVAKLKNAWEEFTMGIMNSGFVKFGIDALTKLLEIVNKATEGFGGFSSSILKIISIMGMFKLGKALFNKFRDPMVQFFADVIKASKEAAEESVTESAKAAKKKSEEIVNGEKSASKKSKKTLGELTGISKLKGNNKRKQFEKDYIAEKRRKEHQALIADPEANAQDLKASRERIKLAEAEGQYGKAL
jgi:TP901 family phage tail tape measure protein